MKTTLTLFGLLLFALQVFWCAGVFSVLSGCATIEAACDKVAQVDTQTAKVVRVSRAAEVPPEVQREIDKLAGYVVSAHHMCFE